MRPLLWPGSWAVAASSLLTGCSQSWHERSGHAARWLPERLCLDGRIVVVASGQDAHGWTWSTRVRRCPARTPASSSARR